MPEISWGRGHQEFRQIRQLTQYQMWRCSIRSLPGNDLPEPDLPKIPTLKKIFGGFGDDALLFFDIDFNGVHSESEPVGRALPDGHVLISDTEAADTNHNGNLDFNEGQWVALGGIDTSSNQGFPFPFTAPANYVMITPSSTLVSKLLQIGAFPRTGEGVGAADTRYLSAFGLADQALAFLDFVSEGANGNADAAALFGKETQFYNTVVMAASLFKSNSSGLSLAALADAAIEDIAWKIAPANSSLTLDNRSVVKSILQGVSIRTGITLTTDVLNAATTAITKANALIETIPVKGTRAYLDSVVKVQTVAQGALAQFLVQLGSADLSIVQFQNATNDLEGQVANAQAYNVLPVYLMVTDASAKEGNAGVTTMQFTVVPFGESALPMSVNYRTTPGSASDGVDYVGVAGTLNWAAGDSSERTITVTIRGDTDPEPDEGFALILSNPVHAALFTAVAHGTIANDDNYHHSTPAGQNNVLALSVSGSRIILQENGSNVWDGAFYAATNFSISGHAGDQLTLFTGNSDQVLQHIGLDGVRTIDAGGQSIQVSGIDNIQSSLLANMTGLPNVLFAGEAFTLVPIVPAALNPATTTYHWEVFAAGASTPLQTGDTPTFEITPTAGDGQIVLTLSDGVHTTNLETAIVVNPPNVAPTLDPIGNRSVPEFGTLSFTASAHDPVAADVLTYSLDPGYPTGATIDPATGRFTWTAGDDPATYSITVRVHDSGNPSLEDSETFTVTVVNVAPTISLVSNSGPVLETNPVTVTITASDLAGAADPLTYWFDFDNNGVYEVSNSTGTAQHAFPDNGSFTVPVKVTDGDGGQAFSSTTVVVNNVPPTIGAVSNNGPVLEMSPASVTITASDIAGAADPLTYWFDFDNNGVYEVSNSTGAALHAFPDNGSYTIPVKVTDGDGGQAFSSTTVIVNNVPPTISAVSNNGPGLEASPVTVTVTASDVAGAADPLTYWFDFNNDGVYELSNSTGVAQHVFSDNGSYTVAVKVTDGDGGQAISSTTAVVNNVPPTINAVSNSGSVFETNSVTVTVMASDVAGGNDPLIYWFDFDNDGSFELSNATGSTSHVYPDNGAFPVRVRVTDDDGGVAISSTTVVVKNLPPVISAVMNNGPVNENSPVRVTVLAQDPAGPFDPLTYWFDFDNNGSYEFSTADNFADHVFPDNGSYLVRVKVSDGDGAEALSSTTVVVNNVAPTISAVNINGPVNEGSSATLTVSATDVAAALDPLIYWFDFDNNGIYEVSNPTGAAAHVYPDNGSYVVGVKVTDGDGGQAISSTTVVVNNVAPLPVIAGPSGGVRGQTLNFPGSFFDPGADTHTFLWQIRDNSGSLLKSGSGFSMDFTPTQSGDYSLTLTVTDDDGATGSATRTVTVVAVQVEPDPQNGGHSMLAVGGSLADDRILISPDGSAANIQVMIDTAPGAFLAPLPGMPFSRVVVFAQDGNDDVQVASNLRLPTSLYGGPGNDRLLGGPLNDMLFGDAGNDILVGGDGNDTLLGGAGNDWLIGGRGGDVLKPEGGSNLVIAGPTRYDSNRAAQDALFSAWASQPSSTNRAINYLAVPSTLKPPSPYILDSNGPRASVLADQARDVLTLLSGRDWLFASLDPTDLVAGFPDWKRHVPRLRR